jgi:hypothetical protein
MSFNQFRNIRHAITCPICFEFYDEERRPLTTVADGCRHTVCQICWPVLLAEKSECPICRKRVQARGPKLNDFILDFALAAHADGITNDLDNGPIIPTPPNQVVFVYVNEDNHADADDVVGCTDDDVVGCTDDDADDLLDLSDTPADDANALPDVIDDISNIANGVKKMLSTSVGYLTPEQVRSRRIEKFSM